LGKDPREAEALGLLGLARRSGGVVSGVEAVRRCVLAGDLSLVVFASDASQVQLEKVMKLLRHHEVPVRWVSRREVLGHAVGGGPLSVLGVKTRSFADRLLGVLSSAPTERSGGGTADGEPKEAR
jgi:ribosomal protein L7Ae-like RNA K-turn-binding protein